MVDLDIFSEVVHLDFGSCGEIMQKHDAHLMNLAQPRNDRAVPLLGPRHRSSSGLGRDGDYSSCYKLPGVCILAKHAVSSSRHTGVMKCIRSAPTAAFSKRRPDIPSDQFMLSIPTIFVSALPPPLVPHL